MTSIGLEIFEHRNVKVGRMKDEDKYRTVTLVSDHTIDKYGIIDLHN